MIETPTGSCYDSRIPAVSLPFAIESLQLIVSLPSCRPNYCLVSLNSFLQGFSIGTAFVLSSVGAFAQTAPVDIAPILSEHCLGCHSGSDPKGGLNLTSKELAALGGDSGSVLNADSPSQSRLWEVIEQGEMPPKKSLPSEAKKGFEKWMQSGFEWPESPINPLVYTTETRAGINWWSLQPLRMDSKTEKQHVAPTRIDVYVDRKLGEHGLTRSPEAEKEILLRRLYFDLTGLPPTSEVVERFVSDESLDAYEKIVDELLASPHYGERWGRYWLDVVRFGETNGYEYDEPRDHFWHYRNWVIQSLNRDLPYDEFVQWQLAGDVLFSDPVKGAAATGFLVAGPHNTTLPAGNPLTRLAMQQDELEELVGVVGQTFLGLTIQCARCHDHKFDPISQQNYYEFAANFSGVRHGEKTMSAPLDKEQWDRQRQIKDSLESVEKEWNGLLQQAARSYLEGLGLALPPSLAIPIPIVNWPDSGVHSSEVGIQTWTKHGAVDTQEGYAVLDGSGGYLASPPVVLSGNAKTLAAWVQLSDLNQSGGGVVSLQSADGNQFDAIVFGERSPQEWMSGSNNFVRTRPVNGEKEFEAIDRAVHVAITYASDGTIQIYRNGLPYGMAYQTNEKLNLRGSPFQIILGLRHTPAGGNRSLKGKIFQAALFDRALSAAEVAWLASDIKASVASAEDLISTQGQSIRAKFASLRENRSEWQRDLNRMAEENKRVIYTHTGTTAEVDRVYIRGEAASPGPLVNPNGIEAVKWEGSDVYFRQSTTEAARRAALARWITDPKNGLFARVMVNRIWHYHFGNGLIPTPNDFGFQGGVPSHPELLDHLAVWFQEEGYRLKPLHRMIVLSAAYRQSSMLRVDAKEVDADNRFLWRFSPRRLDAEEIRDSLLAISHRLNREVGGIGYRDTQHAFVKGTHTYILVDESQPYFQRRTVYRFSARGGRNPLLDTFDCPDPSVATPKRAATTTPLQSLAMLNNPLVFSISESIADSYTKESPAAGASTDVTAAIEKLFLAILHRPPGASEAEQLTEFAKRHGVAHLVRVLLNSNEFLYVR